MEFVGGYPDEYCIFLKNLSEKELACITELDGSALDIEKEVERLDYQKKRDLNGKIY